MAKKIEYDLIGHHIVIFDSKNKELIGVSGKVIDETKNMITLNVQGKTKKIIKKQVVMKETKK